MTTHNLQITGLFISEQVNRVRRYEILNKHKFVCYVPITETQSLYYLTLQPPI